MICRAIGWMSVFLRDVAHDAVRAGILPRHLLDRLAVARHECDLAPRVSTRDQSQAEPGGPAGDGDPQPV